MHNTDAQALTVENVDIKKVKPYKQNAKRHNDTQIANVAESIKQFGWKQPLVLDKDGVIIIGHCRFLAAQQLKLATVPCVIAEDLTPEQARKLRNLDNKLNESEWDLRLLKSDIADLDFSGFNLDWGIDDLASKYTDKTPNALRQKFIVPPFSVLDARNGEWQKRKKAWHSVLHSGNGRSDTLLGSGLMNLAQSAGMKSLTGTSIFDPVLAEILINWFCPKGGKILDPFAGGSVRGIVSQFLQRTYCGNDLSKWQIDENNLNFDELEHSTDFFGQPLKRPTWTNGDSAKIEELVPGNDFDFLFTCPPYADLEKYSDDPADISNMDYPQFLTTYTDILKKSAGKLKENAFACIVVGEVRDKNGIYRNFIGDTIQAAKEAGLAYYNEIILVTMVASASLRAGKIFEASRKVTNTHQKALVFFKNKDDESLTEFLNTFDNSRQLAEMKKSILVFLKGNAKLAKAEMQSYKFEPF